MKRCLAVLVATTLSLSMGAWNATAQQFPSRPIHVVVPFEAGGAFDIIMRVIGNQVMENGGPRIIVENRGGAGGVLGVNAVKAAPPDGYMLVQASSSTHVLNPNMMEKAPYDPAKDFQPIAILVKVPQVLTVPGSSPVKSVADLVALAREKSGGLNYGSAGHGSAPHIAAALLARSSGAAMTHVPFRGMAGAVTALLGNQIDFVFSSLPSLGDSVTDGRVRLLAVSGKDRIKNLPELPSFAELGYPEVDVELWIGLVAPLGTPPDVVATLNGMFVKATTAPQLSERFRKLGIEIATTTPAEFQQVLETENARLGPFVRALGSKPK